jgi:hypothetical protein
VVELPDGLEVELDVYAASGADLSNAGDMLCVSSCNGPFPCAICECKREELNPLKKPATRPKQRTLERIGLLSHTSCTCGICPGCKMEIVATAADVKDPAKQVIRAQAGDDQPTKQDWSEYLRKLKITWLQFYWRRTPALSTDTIATPCCGSRSRSG